MIERNNVTQSSLNLSEITSDTPSSSYDGISISSVRNIEEDPSERDQKTVTKKKKSTFWRLVKNYFNYKKGKLDTKVPTLADKNTDAN